MIQTWIAATARGGQLVGQGEPYPCWCWQDPRSCGSKWCPCWGRLDPFTWQGCCGPTFTTERYLAGERQAALRSGGFTR